MRSVGLTFSNVPEPTNSIFFVLIQVLLLTEIEVPSSIGSKSYWTPSSDALDELCWWGCLTSLSISSITTMPLSSINFLINSSKSMNLNTYSAYYSLRDFQMSLTLIALISPLTSFEDTFEKHIISSSSPFLNCSTLTW